MDPELITDGMIPCRRNSGGPSTAPCGMLDVSLVRLDLIPSYRTCCWRLVRNATIPLQDGNCYTILAQLAEKAIVWDSVEGLAEVQNSNAHLVAEVTLFHQVMHCWKELLGFTRMTQSEPVVEKSEDTVRVKVSSDVSTQDMLYQLADDACQ